jgi:hypothetical protein
VSHYWFVLLILPLLWLWWKSGIPQFLSRKYSACPACGWRLKEMKFSSDARKTSVDANDQGMIVNRCCACKAIWISDPDVPWKDWRVTVKTKVFESNSDMVELVEAVTRGKIPQQRLKAE